MSSIRLSSNFLKSRSSFGHAEDTPFEACGTKQVLGNLEQRNTLDQFHSHFLPLKHNYETPGAMCGYFSIANAMLLSRRLPPRHTLSRHELNEVLIQLEDLDVVSGEVERVMKFVQQCRHEYIEKHTTRFENPSVDIPHYQSDWVANYEISDFLRTEAATGALSDSIHFFRYNQMPEFDEAKHEERERMEEERCFGSAVIPGDKQSAPLQPGATRFIVECFVAPEQGLRRPEHWAQAHMEHGTPAVFVVDVNGHFVVAVPLKIQEMLGDAVVHTLVVINTSSACYLDSPALVYLFDLAFGEKTPP